MSNHTPGPWVSGYGYVDEIGEVFGVGIETEPDWTPVCILSLAAKVNETDEANARLIAAAPELLEAAKSLVEWWEDEHCGITPSVWGIRERLIAAIAKAEGTTSC